MPFRIVDTPMASGAPPPAEAAQAAALAPYWARAVEIGRERAALARRERRLSPAELEELARSVIEEVAREAEAQGLVVPREVWQFRLVGELSGLGPLLPLLEDPSVEDVFLQGRFAWVWRTGRGAEPAGEIPGGIYDALRLLMDQHGYVPPRPDRPIADGAFHLVLPEAGRGLVTLGLRIVYLTRPVAVQGDAVTLRISRPSRRVDLADLVRRRLPPPPPRPTDLPDLPETGEGVLTRSAAWYLLRVAEEGGMVIFSGATGSGKTTVMRAFLDTMLTRAGPGRIRVFLIEDAQEIRLLGWDGSPETDSQNVVYTLTWPGGEGGGAVTAFDLIRAALRARPDRLVIGEGRGAEVWEAVRAASTGHPGLFTLHADSAAGVWPRFLMAARAHPDARGLSERAFAEGFAQAVAAVVHLERHPRYGQIVREIVEVARTVEGDRPAFTPLFRFEDGRLRPTGHRPMREGFTARDLGLPDEIFREAIR